VENKSLCKYVGPFIGVRGDSYRIILLRPMLSDQIEMSCVFLYGEIEVEVRCLPSDLLFGQFTFDIPKTIPEGIKVYYFFKADGVNIDNVDGLEKSDLWFNNVPVSKIRKTALVSCNNPFSFQEKKSSRFNMWDRLNEETMGKETELIILAGDQLYNDNLERFIKTSTIDTNKLRISFIRNYLAYFGILPRKKVMARVPSIAIWDDHDITDGFGSRPEQFRSGVTQEKWSIFFNLAAESFEMFQSSRNPENKFTYSYSNFLDICNTRIYLFDFRSHRNITKKQLFHPYDMNDFKSSLADLPKRIKNVSIVSPVIIARSTTHFDLITRTVAKVTYHLKNFFLNTIGRLGTLDKTIKEGFEKIMIADLCDDLDDSLGSLKNRNEFKKIVNVMIPFLRKDVTFQFLSGDIHTGGESTLSIKSFNETFFLPVIVSSPIGYQPMSNLIEKITTSNDEISLISCGDLVVSQRNGKFISERNFVLLDYLNFRLIKNHFYEYDNTVYRKEFYINSSLVTALPEGIKNSESEMNRRLEKSP